MDFTINAILSAVGPALWVLIFLGLAFGFQFGIKYIKEQRRANREHFERRKADHAKLMSDIEKLESDSDKKID